MERTNKPPEPTLLSVHGVAARYGVKPQTVWVWAQQGKIPQPIRLTAGTSRWHIKDLEEFEERLRQERAPRAEWEENRRRQKLREQRGSHDG